MIEVNNTQMVGCRGDDKIVIMNPKQIMTRHETLELAAYLVVLADHENEFPQYLKVVMN
jgi:hypothetical protein